MRFTGPFRDPVKNAWWNITICSVIVTGFITLAVNHPEKPMLWAGVIGTSAMDLVFIYSLFKAHRDAE